MQKPLFNVNCCDRLCAYILSVVPTTKTWILEIHLRITTIRHITAHCVDRHWREDILIVPNRKHAGTLCRDVHALLLQLPQPLRLALLPAAYCKRQQQKNCQCCCHARTDQGQVQTASLICLLLGADRRSSGNWLRGMIWSREIGTNKYRTLSLGWTRCKIY